MCLVRAPRRSLKPVFNHQGAAIQVVCPALATVTHETRNIGNRAFSTSYGLFLGWSHSDGFEYVFLFPLEQCPHIVLRALVPVFSLSVCVS